MRRQPSRQQRLLLKLPRKQQAEPFEAYTRFTPVYPSSSSGRRLAFARWIVSPDNPLTARVAVNHMWLRHFHQPLVPTVFDFGMNGKPASHPELLDWLASELMESGWKMKSLASTDRDESNIPTGVISRCVFI
jgi:hypothetical protein